MKYCKDCKWYQVEHGICKSPSVLDSLTVFTDDLLAGTGIVRSAALEREDRGWFFSHFCGRKAKYFEPKDTPWAYETQRNSS